MGKIELGAERIDVWGEKANDGRQVQMAAESLQRRAAERSRIL